MRLRFLCQNHRNWLESDGRAANDSWLHNYDLAERFLHDREDVKAVNYAGCSLEVAELLIFAHARSTSLDIIRFTDSAILLCRSLIRVGQASLVRSVIGGVMARMEELLSRGAERESVLGGCQRLLSLPEQAELAGEEWDGKLVDRESTVLPRWALH